MLVSELEKKAESKISRNNIPNSRDNGMLSKKYMFSVFKYVYCRLILWGAVKDFEEACGARR